ncbi:hypothetical protein AMS68_005386 [Peltaster fructicola]|uniref:Uncharacterized protein n=1 Tax=Peltaster fructicola TaxID=286661 RepID=A0A6H0XZ31_9PEZI|nr:hypothetical protein AMS68_005386 [Peltaster fructicola]
MGDNTTRPECHLPRTRNGNEAGAYLSFVLDYYDDLPDYTIFMHDNREQWHNDVGGRNQDEVLPVVRWQGIDTMGFTNLRCVHSPGCMVEITPFEIHEDEVELNTTRARFLGIYQELFGVPEMNVPKEIGNVCCAQFIVTKKQILKRPKSDYERLMKWLIESESDGSHSKGWAFEKIWHIVFSMDPVQ